MTRQNHDSALRLSNCNVNLFYLCFFFSFCWLKHWRLSYISFWGQSMICLNSSIRRPSPQSTTWYGQLQRMWMRFPTQFVCPSDLYERHLLVCRALMSNVVLRRNILPHLAIIYFGGSRQKIAKFNHILCIVKAQAGIMMTKFWLVGCLAGVNSPPGIIMLVESSWWQWVLGQPTS